MEPHSHARTTIHKTASARSRSRHSDGRWCERADDGSPPRWPAPGDRSALEPMRRESRSAQYRPDDGASQSGLCPRVNQSGERDRRGPLTKYGPSYLRWALLEATMHALRHPAHRALPADQAPARKQRGAKVAQVDVARRLVHAIWHMLTRNQEFAPRGARFRLAA